MPRAVILTAKPTETTAVEQLIIGPIGQRRRGQRRPYDVYQLRQKLAPSKAVNGLEIALYETSRGQHEVLKRTEAIVLDFDPDIVLFVGCAGGEPELLQIYDVFVPTDVWPYEIGKESTRGFKSRAHPLKPNSYLLDLARIVAKRKQWQTRVPKAIRAKGKVEFGGVASGNKVLAAVSGKNWQLAKKFSDEIIAVETEAFAFFAAMDELHRPYLMVRGISDNLTNKNSGGKALDDDRQTRATAHAVAFAAQLLIETDYDQLRKVRGVLISSVVESKLIGFWSSTWNYGTEKCADLINIDSVDASGVITGRRVSMMSGFEYGFNLQGTLYGEQLHLTGIIADRSIPLTISLVLKPAGTFRDTLSGIAIRPIADNRPFPNFDEEVVRHENDFWAAKVQYQRLSAPKTDAPQLWSAYQKRFLN